MSDIKRNGFTLVEILVVIALIGALSILVIPSVIKIFNRNLFSAMKVQESEIENASIMFLEDFCKSPLGNRQCPSSIDTSNYTGTLSINDDLVANDYIDIVKLQSVVCEGNVIIGREKNTVCLKCAQDYETDNELCSFE